MWQRINNGNLSRLTSTTRNSNIVSIVYKNIPKFATSPNHSRFLLHGIVRSMNFLVAQVNFDRFGFQSIIKSLLRGSASLEALAETPTDATHLLISFPTEKYTPILVYNCVRIKNKTYKWWNTPTVQPTKTMYQGCLDLCWTRLNIVPQTWHSRQVPALRPSSLSKPTSWVLTSGTAEEVVGAGVSSSLDEITTGSLFKETEQPHINWRPCQARWEITYRWCL